MLHGKYIMKSTIYLDLTILIEFISRLYACFLNGEIKVVFQTFFTKDLFDKLTRFGVY